MFRAGLITATFCVFLTSVSAQTPYDQLAESLPDAASSLVHWDAHSQTSTSGATDSTKDSKSQNKRMFGMIPNSRTVERSAYTGPIMVSQKFKLTTDYFSPFTLVFVGMSAGFDQAFDFKSGYGQGAEGYAKRFGADFTSGFTHTFFVNGVFPSLLHQDPRYFRQGEGSAGSRISYALSRAVVTRQDSGQRAFNYSALLGSTVSSGLAHFYYPESDRSASGFAIRIGYQMLSEAGFNVMREYYPDLARKIFKKKK